MNIPIEIKPVFDRYRGTGKFTVGGVSEFVRRWNMAMLAKGMDLYQWIGYAMSLSEKKGMVDCPRRDYIDANIDFWIDTWRYACDGIVYFSRRNVGSFLEEGLVEMVCEARYDYADSHPGSKDDWIFDLVKFSGEIFSADGN